MENGVTGIPFVALRYLLCTICLWIRKQKNEQFTLMLKE